MKQGNIVQLILKSSLLKSFSIYTIAQVLNAAIPFLLLPIMTKYLSPADYGIISMITTVCAFLTPFISFKLDTAIVRRYYYKDDNIAMYIGNCFRIVFYFLCIVTVIIVITRPFLSEVTDIPGIVLLIIPLFCVGSFLKNVVLYYWQVNNKPIKYGVLSILATFMELSIAIILITQFEFNWVGRAIGLFITNILVALYALLYLIKNRMIDLTYDKSMIRHALLFGAGLVPAAIGSTIMTMSDRFFLTNMVSINETGLYSVACSFSSLLSFFTVSFCNAFVPWMFEHLSNNTKADDEKVVKVSYIYMAGTLLLGGIFYFVIKFLFPFFVSSSFDGSMKYVPWLLLGNVFYGYYLLLTNYIIYSEKTIYSTIITFSCGVIGAFLNFIFINKYGAIGAAMATALSFLVFFVSTWITAEHLYPMPWIRKKEL